MIISPMDGSFARGLSMSPLWRITTPGAGAIHSINGAQWQLRAMVFNRLCDPASKLGCLRWLETVAIQAMPQAVTHQHLLRTMDALMGKTACQRSSRGLNSATGSSTKSKPPDHTVTNFRA